MAKIKVAHLRAQGIHFVVFAADSPSRTNHDRAALLADLANRARHEGFRIDKAALAFTEHGRPTFYGTPDLVRYLSTHGVGRWTHTLTV